MRGSKVFQKIVSPKLVAVLIGALVLLGTSGLGMAVFGVFQGFTDHITQQISKDKREFVDAESCTQWFYRQLKKKPPRPQVEMLSFPHSLLTQETHSCLSQYPNGLDGARAAFSRTQTSLSLSLNYYQFALVGDGNDDGEYNATELKDVLESFDMFFHEGDAPFEYVMVLNHKFDTVRQAIEFTVLTKGMGTLYGRGYRFTSADQAALSRILG